MNKEAVIKTTRAKHGGWPKEAYFSSNPSLRMTQGEMNEADSIRCGPIILKDGKLDWCNDGFGNDGHVNSGGDGPYCSYCQTKL
jgi:hypothetical protein